MTDKPVVVILGAGMGGRGVARALASQAHLIIVDVSLESAQRACEVAVEAGGTAEPAAVNLTDLVAVQDFRDDLTDRHGRVDAVIHLVGGWKGSVTVDSAAIEQWGQLIPGAVSTVQTTTVAFLGPLAEAPAGRYVMVTSTAAETPTKTNAAYAAAKSAAAAWVEATGDAFVGTPARAAIVVVNALVDQAMRDANPGKSFANATDTLALGEGIAALMNDASLASCERVDLTPKSA